MCGMTRKQQIKGYGQKKKEERIYYSLNGYMYLVYKWRMKNQNLNTTIKINNNYVSSLMRYGMNLNKKYNRCLQTTNA